MTHDVVELTIASIYICTHDLASVAGEISLHSVTKIQMIIENDMQTYNIFLIHRQLYMSLRIKLVIKLEDAEYFSMRYGVNRYVF